MNIREALALIIERSEDTSVQAAAAKARLSSGRAQLERFERLLPDALASGEFSADERRQMMALIEELTEDAETRTDVLRVRVTPSERADLEARAERESVTLSEYVRTRLFG